MKADPHPPLLERITAVVLVLVMLVLGWIVAAAYSPNWGRWIGLEVQVGFALVLLTAALLLVSVVALRHTRSGSPQK